jgi:hypothetical protein
VTGLRERGVQIQLPAFSRPMALLAEAMFNLHGNMPFSSSRPARVAAAMSIIDQQALRWRLEGAHKAYRETAWCESRYLTMLTDRRRGGKKEFDQVLHGPYSSKNPYGRISSDTQVCQQKCVSQKIHSSVGRRAGECRRQT